MYAAHGDHPHSCNELLLRGADVTLQNHSGETAYSLAVENESKLGTFLRVLLNSRTSS